VRTAPLGVLEVPGAPFSLWVLRVGYCHPLPDGGFSADGSVTLIRGGPITLLVDTGGPWGGEELVGLLAGRGVSPDDVTHVVCTHGHPDHAGNLGLFGRGGRGGEVVMWVGGEGWRGRGRFLRRRVTSSSGGPYVLHPGGLEVRPTSGHTRDDVSVLVRGTALGTVLVAGDLFEEEEDEEEEEEGGGGGGGWRAWSDDVTTQERSRRWALGVADVIVPGHGAPFRVLR
ncbi:MBLC1 protein, partial [Atlantisia rogersi]|nr:MBLC1 protein [Atlantisia rogersi]